MHKPQGVCKSVDKLWFEQELSKHIIHVEQLHNNKLIIQTNKLNRTADKCQHRLLGLTHPLSHIHETMSREYVAYNIREDILDVG